MYYEATKKGGTDMNENRNLGLYDKSFEHDNCGIGAVVNIKGVKDAYNSK